MELDGEDADKEGSGLGLYIAKSLMVKMNGELIGEAIRGINGIIPFV